MNRSTGRIGIDESGKGDYFGPLVVAGVYADQQTEETLVAEGIRDCKTLSDSRVGILAERIRSVCPCEVVVIGPERYNTLQTTLGNVNRLLAWGHARVIENLLVRVNCQEAISDQFGDRRFLQQALMERGRAITLIQRPRAESEPVVAAASIIARAEFLRRLQQLESRYRCVLPKGAGAPVLTAAIRFVQQHGSDALVKVAKVHFRTTAQVLHRVASPPEGEETSEK